MTKIDELLTVLDMPEEEQWDWLLNRADEFWPNEDAFYGERERYIADLAFRLRDEVMGEAFGDFGEEVFLEGLDKVQLYIKDKKPATAVFGLFAQPIHWIIAALIAEENQK